MMEIKFTRHAEGMIKERGIDKMLIEDAVLNPDWKEKTGNELWYAFKKVRNKVLRVVVRREKPYTVVTAYYNRRLKNES